MSKLPRFSASFVIGVGNNVDPVTFVRGADGARRNAIPFKIKPALGHVSENSSHPISKQRCHVLHDCVLRSYQAKGSHKFPVQSRTLSGKAGAFSSTRNILAGESSSNDIGHSFVKAHLGHVGGHRYARPVLMEYGTAERIDFTHRGDLESCALQAEFKSANSAEEAKNLKRAHHFTPPTFLCAINTRYIA